MDNKLVVVYTMKGCPWCDMFKQRLTEDNVEFMKGILMSMKKSLVYSLKLQEVTMFLPLC